MNLLHEDIFTPASIHLRARSKYSQRFGLIWIKSLDLFQNGTNLRLFDLWNTQWIDRIGHDDQPLDYSKERTHLLVPIEHN